MVLATVSGALPLASQAPAPTAGEATAARPSSAALRTSDVFAVSLSGSYHENPFNLRKHWDGAPDPGRIHGYSVPWDFVSTLGVEYTRRWQGVSGSRLTLGAGGGYQHYALHGQHDHASLSGSMSYRTVSRSNTALGLNWSPRTLLGNRRSAETEEFARAYYSAYSMALNHRRDLGGGWTIRPEAEYAVRRFDAPFAARDRQSIRLATRVARDSGGPLAISGTAAGGHISPLGAGGDDLLTSIRYYEGGASLTWRHGATSLRGRARLRSMHYLQDADGTDRQDLAWRLDVRAAREITRKTSLWTQLGGRTRSSERYSDDVLLETAASTGIFLRAGADFTF
jgi:hypothetical protein